MQRPQPVDLKEVTDAIAAAHQGLSPDDLLKYFNEILRWNPRIGLVSKQDTVDVIDRLVRQSARLLGLVRPRAGSTGIASRHIVDIGSGGGFPGLIWAMIEHDWSYLLVERRHKKAVFLERMVRLLRLKAVKVYAGTAEDAQRTGRFSERFDTATTMAVGRPGKTASLVEAFLRPGGLFATTVPRDERSPSERVGAFRLQSTESDDETLFALYVKD